MPRLGDYEMPVMPMETEERPQGAFVHRVKRVHERSEELKRVAEEVRQYLFGPEPKQDGKSGQIHSISDALENSAESLGEALEILYSIKQELE